MSRTTLQTVGFLGALACIVAVAPMLWQIETFDDVKGGLPIGQQMPEFTGIEGWLNGDQISGEDTQGKVVFVNAWFLNCPYCHKGMPFLVDVYNEYRDKGVVFVGMTFDTGKDAKSVKRFLEKYKVEWPNAYGATETLAKFQAEYFPGYWVIGRDGKVVWNKSLQGKVAVRDAIEAALAASPPAASPAAAPGSDTTDPEDASAATAQL